MNARPKFGFVVEYVTDMDAAKRFYTDVLGLKVEREHPAFIQFDTFAIATDEPVGGEAKQELYWLVSDADQALRGLAAKAEICLPLKQVPFGKVFGVRDPDGQPRYVLELARHRPSQEVK